MQMAMRIQRLFPLLIMLAVSDRIRIQFIRLNEFRESWIPTLKAGGFRQFQLFDLDQDITQRTDVSREHPEVLERMKKALLEIHASVMLDGPDWSVSANP